MLVGWVGREKVSRGGAGVGARVENVGGWH